MKFVCELRLEPRFLASGLGLEVVRMMSVTGKGIDFAGKNLVSGCSSNASFDWYTVRNYAKANSNNSNGCGRGHGRKLVCCKRRSTQCRVSSMKTAQPTVNGTIFEFNFYAQISHSLSVRNHC